MRKTVTVRGRGRAEVAAYGVQDAEHLVEKELARLWPEARVEVLEIRMGEAGRIVGEFVVTYRLTAAVEVEVEDEAEAPRHAYRHARGLLAGSRYAGITFEAPASS